MADSHALRALLIDGDPDTARMTLDLLSGAGIWRVDPVQVDRLALALEHLRAESFDVILLALASSEDGGGERLERLLVAAPGVPVIGLAEAAETEMALAMIRRGAQDFWIRGQDTGDALRRAMRFAVARQAQFTRLAHQATHDRPTGLPNRQLFEDRLAHAAARAKRCRTPLAVLFIDVDGFKQVNDRLGHAAGDRILRGIAERLTGTSRESDTVARIGGDEFAIVLESLGRVEDAAVVAQKILDALAPPFIEGDEHLELTCSIGISFFLLNGTDARSLLDHADQAMYRAKQQGGNRYSHYTEDLGTPALARFHLVSALRAALERKEFQLFFQPQVNLVSGTLRGFEALLRWRHPEHGLLGPEAFMAIAEDSALIEPLEDWVLRAACAQMKRWHDAGVPPLHMAVNLSAHGIVKRSLSAHLGAILAQAGLPPSLLELDIKGTPLVRDNGASAGNMCELKEVGIRLALDDFGDGHSAISYLRRLPFDVLKLDRTLIRGTARRGPERIIAHALTELAHSLAFTVVAMGVETEAQLSFVRETGCDVVQGDLISPPLDAEAATVWLDDGPPLPTAAPWTAPRGPNAEGPARPS